MATKTQGSAVYYLSGASTVTKIPGVSAVSGTGGARTQIPSTTLEATTEQSIPGLRTQPAPTITFNYDPDNEVHRDLRDRFLDADQEPTVFIVAESNGSAAPTATGGVITYPPTRSYKYLTAYVSDFPTDAALNSKYETTMALLGAGEAGWQYSDKALS